MSRRGVALLGLAVAALFVGAYGLRAANTLAGTSLELATAPATIGQALCPLAQLVPATVSHADGRLVFRNGVGDELALVWPHGYSARLVGDIGELLDPNGAIVARDGDTLSNIGGGGEPFTVCPR